MMIEIGSQQVQVSQAGERVAVVSLWCSRGRNAVGKICLALEPLRLRVVTATIAARGDTVFHTLFVEVIKQPANYSLPHDGNYCGCPCTRAYLTSQLRHSGNRWRHRGDVARDDVRNGAPLWLSSSSFRPN